MWEAFESPVMNPHPHQQCKHSLAQHVKTEMKHNGKMPPSSQDKTCLRSYTPSFHNHREIRGQQRGKESKCEVGPTKVETLSLVMHQ